MPSIFERSCHSGILLQCLAHSVRRDLHAMRLEQVQHPPDANPRAILIIALHIQRALAWPTRTARLLPEEVLGLVVAVQNGPLGSLRGGCE